MVSSALSSQLMLQQPAFDLLGPALPKAKFLQRIALIST